MANILIVDDSMLERKVLSDMLTSLGHTIVGQAKNADQAIEEYMNVKPDLVTMDLTMEDTHGADAISGILAADPQARIVVISSHQEKKIILDVLQRGARHFLVKPIESNELASVVNNVLQQSYDKDKQQELLNLAKKTCAVPHKPKHHAARVLIVDDSALTRQMLHDIITALGHVVVGEAANATQAFVEFSRLKPDLMTLDLSMQGENGANAISKIILTHPDARIIVISAIDSKTAIMDVLERGARHFVVKPIHPEKIADAIETVLSQDIDLQKQTSFMQKLRADADLSILPEHTVEYTAPYLIHVQTDKLIKVRLDPSLTPNSCRALMMELEEYLKENPRVLLHFGTIPHLDQELFIQFNELSQAVKENAGVIHAISNNQEFISHISAMEPENTTNLLAEVLKYAEN